MNAITVFCSSSTFLDPEFHEPARIVGRELARRRISLVYGGGGIGLMVEIARACREHGGRVQTAAGFMGRADRLLEARRKELHAGPPPA